MFKARAMKEAIGVKFSKETLLKLMEESVLTRSTLTKLIRKKVEQSYGIESQVTELYRIRKWQEEYAGNYSSHIKMSKNLAWFAVTLLSEYIKKTAGEEAFKEIEKSVLEKFESFSQDQKLKL